MYLKEKEILASPINLLPGKGDKELIQAVVECQLNPPMLEGA